MKTETAYFGVCNTCGTELWVCPYCSKIFTTKQGLAGHMKIHKSSDLERIARIVEKTLGKSEAEIVREVGEPVAGLLLLLIIELRAGEKSALAAKKGERKIYSSKDEKRLDKLPSFVVDNPWIKVLGGRKE